MKCQICERKIDEHSRGELEKCLQTAFGIDLREAFKFLMDTMEVTGFSQPQANRAYTEINMWDGSVIRSSSMDLDSARLLLVKGKLKSRPKINKET